MGIPHDPAILPLVIYQKKKKKRTLIRKDAYTPKSIAALFSTDKTRKQCKWPSTDDSLKRI